MGEFCKHKRSMNLNEEEIKEGEVPEPKRKRVIKRKNKHLAIAQRKKS